MTTTQTEPASRPTWQAGLPMAARLGLAAAVVAVLVPVWTGAKQASREAVQTAGQAFGRPAVHVTLPSVQVIGKRDPAAPQRRSAG